LFPFTNRAATYIGDISFSLYLWHFPFIILCGQLIDLTAGVKWILLVAIFVWSSFMFHLVEDPIRKSSWLGPKSKKRRATAPVFTRTYQLTALSFLAVVTAAVVVPQLIAPPGAGQVYVVPSTVATASATDA